MARKKIKAKEPLNDIRAGMDDEGLMEKYGFSTNRILMARNRLI